MFLYSSFYVSNENQLSNTGFFSSDFINLDIFNIDSVAISNKSQIANIDIPTLRLEFTANLFLLIPSFFILRLRLYSNFYSLPQP